MRVSLIRIAIAVVSLLFSGVTADAGEGQSARIESFAVPASLGIGAPLIDGRASDGAWNLARASRITVRESEDDKADQSSSLIIKNFLGSKILGLSYPSINNRRERLFTLIDYLRKIPEQTFVAFCIGANETQVGNN